MRISDWSSDVCSSDLFVGQYTAIDREAAADERPTEERRTDMMKRQDTGQRAVRIARGDEMARVPGGAGDRLAPRAAVERRRVRVRGDRGAPVERTSAG